MISRYLLILLSMGLATFAYAQDSVEPATTGSAVATIQVVDAEPEITTEEPSLDSGNTAWMLTATALVLFMTLPGLALFYGGLVQSKNVLSVLMHCFAIACLASIIWFAVGYSLALTPGGLGDESRGWIGGTQHFFLQLLSADSLNGDHPETVWIMFQMTFAIITPALIVGAFVERIKFSAVLLLAGYLVSSCLLPGMLLGMGRWLAR